MQNVRLAPMHHPITSPPPPQRRRNTAVTPQPHPTFAPKPMQEMAEDVHVDPAFWPDRGVVRGLMTPTQFMNAVDAFTDEVMILAGPNNDPSEEVAHKIELAKVAGSTADALLFGAPHRHREAMRAPPGSTTRRHALWDCLLRGMAAVLTAPTVIIPVVTGTVGCTKGERAADARYVRRFYRRKMIQRNVLRPMLKMLQDESPIPLLVEHRAQVRAFLDVCESHPAVKFVLKPHDTQDLKNWLNNATAL